MNVVLVEPEIPWNTGNIGRTCVAAGATLHLVGRLGFRIDQKEIRRSGLDYWPKLDLKLHADVEAFLASGLETRRKRDEGLAMRLSGRLAVSFLAAEVFVPSEKEAPRFLPSKILYHLPNDYDGL